MSHLITNYYSFNKEESGIVPGFSFFVYLPILHTINKAEKEGVSYA